MSDDTKKWRGSRFMTVTQDSDDGANRFPSDGQGGSQAGIAGNDTEALALSLVESLSILSTATGVATVTLQSGNPAVAIISNAAYALVANMPLELNLLGSRLPPSLLLNVAWSGGALNGVATLNYNGKSRY